MPNSKDLSGASIGGNFLDASGSNITDSNVAGRDAGDATYNNVPSAEIEGLKAEIQALWEEVASDRPTETFAQQAAIVTDIENNPTWRQRFVAAFEAGGIELLKKAIDNPAIDALVAAVKGWKGG